MKTPVDSIPHVLIVEDNEDLRDAFGIAFEHHNYHVETAASGLLALHYLAQSTPHLMILDYEMPEMTGLEVMAFVRRHPRLSSLRIILLTGNPFVFNTPEALSADMCLAKPVSLRDLTSLADRLIAS